MASSRFLLPAGAAFLMALISKGVASDAARRDRLGVEPAVERPPQTLTMTTDTPPPMVVSLSDDDTTSTDDDLDDDSTVP
jgi:hypothetical protein